MKPSIVTFAGSARRSSLNKTLARRAAIEADSIGAEGSFVDLADYPLPLYNGDLEDLEGIPANALALAEVIRGADGLFIASPEYNGSYSALLKNTLDWISRIDRNVLVRPTAIASATPGRRGGVTGLRALRATLEHMRVPVLGHQLSIPGADKVLSGFERADVETAEAVRSVIRSLVRQSELERSTITAA